MEDSAFRLRASISGAGVGIRAAVGHVNLNEEMILKS